MTLAPDATARAARPLITSLIDEATVGAIAGEAWVALVGEEELLVPVPGALPEDALSTWVDVVGPWTGSVVLTAGHGTAVELTRALLAEATPAVLEPEDVTDAFGEIANVVGGNVKAALPGPSTLSLPQVGDAPAVRNPDDVCRVEVLWRGQPLVITVHGALPSTSPQHEDPHHENPHHENPHPNGVSL